MLNYRMIIDEINKLDMNILIDDFYIDSDFSDIDILFSGDDFKSFIKFLCSVQPKVIFINNVNFNYDASKISEEDVIEFAKEVKINSASITSIVNDEIQNYNNSIDEIVMPDHPIVIIIRCFYEGKCAYYSWEDQEFLNSHGIAQNKLSDLYFSNENEIKEKEQSLISEKMNELTVIREKFVETLCNDIEFQKKTNSELRSNYINNIIFKSTDSLYNQFKPFYDLGGSDRLYLNTLMQLALARIKEKHPKSK